MPSSSTTTRARAPGSSGSGCSWLSRCVRLSTPRVTSSELPSGATSQSRAAICATGRSLSSSSSTRALPISSIRSGSAAEVKLSARPSSARWSTALSASLPSAHQTPLSRPQSRSVEISSRRSSESGSSREPAVGQPQPSLLDARRGPGLLRHPAARRAPRAAPRAPPAPASTRASSGSSAMPVSSPFSHWSHQRRHSWRKPIAGPGSTSSGNACDHGPISPFDGAPRPGHEPQDRLGVPVGPAADRVDGALDRAEVLADGALLPVVVAALVAKPLVLVRLHAVDALEPCLAPPRPRDLRVRRDRVEGEHRGSPREHLERQHRAAAVVHVVRVAVVRRAEADHRLQLRRAAGRHLEPVEAAPGDAEHAGRARAPGLLPDPAEHLHRVLLLLRQVLVVEQAVGLAAAAQVHAQHRVAVAREVGVARLVARRRAVALPVGDVLEDRRHRVALGVLGQPDARAEPRAVGQRDPHVVDSAHRARQVRDDPHSREVLSGTRNGGPKPAIPVPLRCRRLVTRARASPPAPRSPGAASRACAAGTSSSRPGASSWRAGACRG